MTDWTKEEYAEIHWNGVMEYIAEMNDENLSDRDKLYQLFGYMEAWKESDDQLKHDYETR